jgi:integrase
MPVYSIARPTTGRLPVSRSSIRPAPGSPHPAAPWWKATSLRQHATRRDNFPAQESTKVPIIVDICAHVADCRMTQRDTARRPVWPDSVTPNFLRGPLLTTKVLTPLAVKAAKPKRNAGGELVRAEYPDRGCAGMYLVVQSSGLKSWALRYRFDRKTRKLTLGAVVDHEAPGLTDALTLAGARKAAAAAKHLVDQGIDPAAQKQAAKANSAALATQRAADGVEPLADQFLRLYAAPKTRPRTYQQTEDVLRRLVLPIWRGRTVHDIKRRDVIALVDDIAGERGPHMANKTLAVLGRWFSWLVGRDVVAVSPCLGVERPARDVPRERTLDTREIVTLWRACGEESVFGAFVRILLLTGCRRAEAAAMQWSELDEAQRLWSLPRERVKNGVPHAVPLAPQAWAIIAAQPRFVGSHFVFSNDGGRRPIGGFSRSKRKLDERIKPAAPWCLHDTRRTCASGMQRLGIRVEVVERCLNHTSGAYRGIAGVYMRDPMLEAKREAFEGWARHIEQLVSGEPAANIRHIRTRG